MRAAAVVGTFRPVLRVVPKSREEGDDEARARGELTWYFGSYESEMGLKGVDYDRGETNDGFQSEPRNVHYDVRVDENGKITVDGSGKFYACYEENARKDTLQGAAWERGEKVRGALGQLTWLQQFTLEALFTPGALTNGRQIIRVATGDEDCGRIGHHSATLRALVIEHGSIEAAAHAWEESGKGQHELWSKVKREVAALKATSIRAYLVGRGFV